MIVRLELAKGLGVKHIKLKRDSQPVVNKIQGTYVACEAHIQKYLEKAKVLLT